MSDDVREPFVTVRIERRNWFAEQWQTRPDRVWLVSILLLSLSLRLIRLGTWPYWHDEVHNILTSQIFGEVLGGELVSNHPPLFTFLVMLWRGAGLGENEWTMRLLPTLLGVVSTWAVFVCARKLVDTRTGLIAAFLVAISPLHLVHSQDLKEYMVLPITGPLAVYFFYRASEENRAYLWALYGLWAGLACYSELFVAPMLVSINVWFLLLLKGRRNRLVGWFLGNLFGAVLFLPQLGVMLHKAGLILNAPGWWIPAPTLVSVAFYFKAIAFGYSDLKPHFAIAMGIYAVLGAVGTLVVWRRNGRAALLLLLWFALSTAIVFVLSRVMESVFLIRSMLPYALAYYILVAAALAWIRPVPLRAVALVGLGVLAAFPLSQRYLAEYPPHEFPHRPGVHPPTEARGAAQYVLAGWREGDVIVQGSAPTWVSMYWYGLRGHPQFFGTTDQGFIDTFHRGNPRMTENPEYDGYFPSHVQDITQGNARVWFVFGEWEREALPYNVTQVWRWLDNHYTELEHRRFRGIEVFLYGQTLNERPAQTVARLADDAAVTDLVYAAGAQYLDHQKLTPDSGLTAMEPEERRGRLSLRFDSEPAPEIHAFTTDSTASTVTFAVENRTDTNIGCRIEVVPSDVLIDAASWMETEPLSDVWAIAPRYNVQPPPARYDNATAVARLTGPAGDGLSGSVRLAPATYDSFVYLLGWPGDPANARAGLSLKLGGTDLVAVPKPPNLGGDWEWVPGAPLTVTTPDVSLPVEVRATPVEGLSESWVNLGYVALRRQRPGATQALWPGEVSLAPHSTRRWAARFDTDRIDVWVYERGEGGRAYRIFRTVGAPGLASGSAQEGSRHDR